jgi:hypothetical protein
MRWVGHEARMGENRNACKVLVEKSKGKRPFERTGLGCRIILKLVLLNVDWIDVAHTIGTRLRAVVNAVTTLLVPRKAVGLASALRDCCVPGQSAASSGLLFLQQFDASSHLPCHTCSSACHAVT